MGTDRISALPDSLITQILLELPTKESAKTSILSTRWRDLWLKVPGLDLKVSDYYPPHGEQVLGSFMKKFMECNLGQLQKFKVKINRLHRLCEDNECNDWIPTVVNCEIQHVDVKAKISQIVTEVMPFNIYKSKTLVSLKLANVCLENKDNDFYLPCLKIMQLQNICYGEDGPSLAEKLISGCPVLEDLTVVRVYMQDIDILPLLRVKSQSLKIFRYTFDWGMDTTYFSVEIDAPGLKFMSFKDNQSDLILLKNLSSLYKIDLDTEFNVEFDGSPSEPDDLRTGDMILCFLTDISSVRHMIISQPTLEVLSSHPKRIPIPKFRNLSHLEAAFSSSSLQLLPAFLESCPNLKKFIIMDYYRTDELEQLNFTAVPECFKSTLEYVEIKRLILLAVTGIELVNYFLKNSAVLKKLILSLADSPTNNQGLESFLETYKKLLTSTKLSRTCQVIIG